VSRHLQVDLDRLRQHLLELGALVESAVRKAITSLRERRLEVARLVIEGDGEIDRREIELEEDCLKALALHQPVAGDLRFIASCLKINNDLERVGDLAVNIAERSEELAREPAVAFPEHLLEMSEMSARMVRQSLDAFVSEDAVAARRVCAEDDQVDEFHRATVTELQSVMRADGDTVDRAMRLVSVSRNLERIADHATNIAEDVVYMVEGEIIRHPSTPPMQAG